MAVRERRWTMIKSTWEFGRISAYIRRKKKVLRKNSITGKKAKPEFKFGQVVVYMENFERAYNNDNPVFNYDGVYSQVLAQVIEPNEIGWSYDLGCAGRVWELWLRPLTKEEARKLV